MRELNKENFNLSNEEFNKILEWGKGEDRSIPSLPIHSLFEKCVEENAEEISIVDNDLCISYIELNGHANQLARYLKKRGIESEDKVGIFLDRSYKSIVSILAILKVGAAYVPLDKTLPLKRLKFIIEDTQVKSIITTQDLVKHLNFFHKKIILLDSEKEHIFKQKKHNLSIKIEPNALAYIMYTSGSTGTPKGVLVEHKSIVNFSLCMIEEFNLNKFDKVLQFANFGFDVSVFEIFATLLAGARMVIVKDLYKRSPKKLTKLMQEGEVTVAELPPALLPLLSSSDFPSLRIISVGGEKFSGELVELWATPNRRMINGYGPTETTVAVTLYECKGVWEVMPPIGRPIANHRVYVLNNKLQPVPSGVFGELYIAGIGVSRGYLNRQETTDESFINNPFTDDPNYNRIYKTGDIVRWLPDGNLEIKGRSDRQIQIRGLRVELGEIEGVITRFKGIGQTVVETVNHSGSIELVAYIVPNQKKKIQVIEIREYLLQHLPTYMVPNIYNIVNEIPLTPNGKVDRALLRNTTS